MNNRVARWFLGLTPLVLALLLWQLLGSAESFSFPEPSTWWGAGRELAVSGELWPALRSTILTFVVSMVLATVIGVVAGVALGFLPRVERTLTPAIDFFRTLPPPVVVPVLTLILGLTLEAGVTIVVFSVVWPILLNTIGAVHEISPVRREMGLVLGLSGIDRFLKITLPSLLPGILVGVRTALSMGLVVTLLADILGSGDGIGRLLVIQQQLLESERVWALLALIGILGYTLNLAVQAVAGLALRHHPVSRA